MDEKEAEAHPLMGTIFLVWYLFLVPLNYEYSYKYVCLEHAMNETINIINSTHTAAY